MVRVYDLWKGSVFHFAFPPGVLLTNRRAQCYNIYALLFGRVFNKSNPILYTVAGCSYLFFNSSISKSIPDIIASVRVESILSAQNCIFFASSSEIRIVIFPVRDCFPFGGRPVLGDIFSLLSFGRAYIIYYALPKVNTFFSCLPIFLYLTSL